MRTRYAVGKAFALLRCGDQAEALRTIDTAGHLSSNPTFSSALLQLVTCLVRREAAGDQDPAVPRELLDLRADAAADAHDLVALLVEQALREPDPAVRRALTDQAEAERNGLRLPYGYLAELEQLSGQA